MRSCEWNLDSCWVRPCFQTASSKASGPRLTICLAGKISAYARIGLETRNCLALPRSCCKTNPHGAWAASKKGNSPRERSGPIRGWELVIPNPKLKLMDQLRRLRIEGPGLRVEGVGLGARPDPGSADARSAPGPVSRKRQRKARWRQQAGESPTAEVPGYQWDALKPWRCCCRITRIRPPALRWLTAPVTRAGLAGVSPDTRRTLAVVRLIPKQLPTCCR
jgi:hypothetical protein